MYRWSKYPTKGNISILKLNNLFPNLADYQNPWRSLIKIEISVSHSGPTILSSLWMDTGKKFLRFFWWLAGF